MRKLQKRPLFWVASFLAFTSLAGLLYLIPGVPDSPPSVAGVDEIVRERSPAELEASSLLPESPDPEQYLDEPLEDEDALAETPVDTQVDRLIGSAFDLLADGRIESAVDILKQVVRLDPNNAEAMEHLGRIYGLHYEDPEKAAQYLEKAVSLNPENSSALSELVFGLIDQGKAAEAEAKLIRLAKDHPAAINIRETLGAFYADRGDLGKAVAQFEKAASSADHPEFPLVSLADVYQRAGRFTEAAEVYERVVKTHESRLRNPSLDYPKETIEAEIEMSKLDWARALIKAGRYVDAEEVLTGITQKSAPNDYLDKLIEDLDKAKTTGPAS